MTKHRGPRREARRRCRYCGRDEQSTHAASCPKRRSCQRCGAAPAIADDPRGLCAPCLGRVQKVRESLDRLEGR